MKILYLVKKLYTKFISWSANNSCFNDFAVMVCFMLGVYGERFFLYICSLLRWKSPEEFAFLCLFASYCIISKFIHN